MNKLGLTFCLMSLLVFSATMITAKDAQGTNTQNAPRKTIYQLTWQADNVAGTIEVNGFPVGQLSGETATGTAALNIWLTGNNEVRAQVGKHDKTSAASFSLGVSEMVVGDIVSTGDEGSLINVELTDAQLSSGTPGPISEKFTSALDFSKHLVAAEPSRFNDRAVLDYAINLYGLYQKKDAEGILKEMSTKIEDYAAAYYETAASVSQAFASMLEDEILQSELEKIDPKQLRAERIKNLWHIYEGQAELIRSKYSDGATSELPVWIGEIDGRLRVVR